MENEREDFVDENTNNVDDREEATLGMTEIDGFDFERAVMLMSVMEKVANIAPKSSAISGLAGAALNEMNEEAKEIAKRRAEEFEKLAAQRAEALVAQQKEREAQEARDAEMAARPQVTQPAPAPAPQQGRAIPHTQFDAPAPSKTDTLARDNARRV